MMTVNSTVRYIYIYIYIFWLSLVSTTKDPGYTYICGSRAKVFGVVKNGRKEWSSWCLTHWPRNYTWWPMQFTNQRRPFYPDLVKFDMCASTKAYYQIMSSNLRTELARLAHVGIVHADRLGLNLCNLIFSSHLAGFGIVHTCRSDQW